MFDLVDGLPLHPLVVHAIVVLLPLTTLGTIAIAVRPRWRQPYGPLVVTAALIVTVLCPVATSSGEQLEQRVGDPGRHADLGGQLIWFALPLLVLSTALVLLARRAARESGPSGLPARLVTIVAVLAVVAGGAAGFQVYRVGESGARAVWGDVGATR